MSKDRNQDEGVKYSGNGVFVDIYLGAYQLVWSNCWIVYILVQVAPELFSFEMILLTSVVEKLLIETPGGRSVSYISLPSPIKLRARERNSLSWSA